MKKQCLEFRLQSDRSALPPVGRSLMVQDMVNHAKEFLVTRTSRVTGAHPNRRVVADSAATQPLNQQRTLFRRHSTVVLGNFLKRGTYPWAVRPVAHQTAGAPHDLIDALSVMRIPACRPRRHPRDHACSSERGGDSCGGKEFHAHGVPSIADPVASDSEHLQQNHDFRTQSLRGARTQAQPAPLTAFGLA